MVVAEAEGGDKSFNDQPSRIERGREVVEPRISRLRMAGVRCSRC